MRSSAGSESWACILKRSFTRSDKNSPGSLPWQYTPAQSPALFADSLRRGKTVGMRLIKVCLLQYNQSGLLVDYKCHKLNDLN